MSTFEEFQALRARLAAAAELAAADPRASTSTHTRTLRLKPGPGTPTYTINTAHAHILTHGTTVLALMLLEVLLLSLAVVYEVHAEERIRKLYSNSVLYVAARHTHTLLCWAPALLWVAQAVEHVLGIADARRRGFPLSRFRALDIVFMLIGAYMLATRTHTAYRLFCAVRLVRAGEIFASMDERAALRQAKLEADIVAEKKRVEGQAARLAALETRVSHEDETRARYDESIKRYRHEIEMLREALLVAAQEMASRPVLDAPKYASGAAAVPERVVDEMIRDGASRVLPTQLARLVEDSTTRMPVRDPSAPADDDDAMDDEEFYDILESMDAMPLPAPDDAAAFLSEQPGGMRRRGKGKRTRVRVLEDGTAVVERMDSPDDAAGSAAAEGGAAAGAEAAVVEPK